MQEHGLEATLCCAQVPSVIVDPFFAEPAAPEDRIVAMCEAVRRFARFRPAGILITTGAPGDYDPAETRRIVVEGLKQVADVAGEHDITLGLEPYRKTSGTLVTTLPPTQTKQRSAVARATAADEPAPAQVAAAAPAMPKTASPLPLLGLLALVSGGIALSLRAVRALR